MARYQTEHGPTVSGGMVLGFTTVVGATVAAFMAASAGAFDRKPVARMDILQPQEAVATEIGPTPVARMDFFEPLPSAASEIRARSPDLVTMSSIVDNTPATAGPSCDVRACAQAFRSFRSSDCTFQPYDGPRRLCAM